MQSPREILTERLAKGEISPEQYDDLLGRIGDPQNVPLQAPAKTKSRNWLWLAALGVIIGLGLSLVNGMIGGLSVNNISGSGNTIEFTLVNSGKMSGDVVVSVTSMSSGAEYCRVVVAMSAGSSKKLRFRCGEVDMAGTVGVTSMWAEAADSDSLPRVN